MVLLGFDLIFLGITITAWDAFDEGESMRAHFVRSFISALYDSGALALLSSLFSDNSTLILILITFRILTQIFSSSIQSLLDKLTLPPRTIKELETLRQTADVLPRRASRGLEAGEIDEEEFTRLTRRALSNPGDLPKLATSPLVHLPIIEGTNPLDRAHALRAMLVQSIQKLNPKYPLGKNQMITISQ